MDCSAEPAALHAPPKSVPGNRARSHATGEASALACSVSVRFSPRLPELLEVVSSHDEVARFVGRSDFLKGARARLDPGNRRDGRKALACGGVAVALYAGTHEEAPGSGLIHPALPLFDLAAGCYPDERRNLDSTRSESFHAGRYMASSHATYSPAPATTAVPRS